MSDLRLGDLADADSVAPRLPSAVRSSPGSAEKARRFASCARALVGSGAAPDAPAVAWFVPGRIEVLGKHTDYAGGRSIVAAADRGVCMVASPRDDAAIRATALDLGEACQFPFSPDLGAPVGHWSNYPMTVARRLARNFPGPLRGAALAFTGDLPVAAGMSSSSALVVAACLALSDVNRLEDRPEYRREIRSPEDLAAYLGCVENGQSFGALAGDRGVGTFGGSEDHVAMLCCRDGMLSQYSYCPVRLERHIRLPPDLIFAVAASGVAAEKTGQAMEKYNLASRRARAVVEVWNAATGRHDPHIAAALASDPGAAERRIGQVLLDAPAGGEFCPGELYIRYQQFLFESEYIVPAAAELLEAGGAAIADLGGVVDRSQRLAEDMLENQVPQTSFLARSARELGAVAASAFGAGFGGSVWALVRRQQAEQVLSDWRRLYAEAFPAQSDKAAFFLTAPGPAAFRLV